MKTFALAAAASLAAVSSAAAQDGRVAAVTVIEASTWPDPALLRRAMAAPDVAKWGTAADYPADARAQGRTGTVGITVTVGADDRVTGCAVDYANGEAGLAENACALARRKGRFRHALAVDGTPVAGTVDLAVVYEFRRPGETPSSLPPAMMRPQGWPLLYYSPGATVARPPDWSRFAGAGETGEVGILLDFNSGRPPGCRVLKSSGISRLDSATCSAARSGEYAVDPARGSAELPMIVRWAGKRADVQLPLRGDMRRAEARSPSDLIVRGVPLAQVPSKEIAAYVDVDEAGRPAKCRILYTAGSDAADIALCRHLLKQRFNPAQDVFGRPMESTAYVPVQFR